MTYSVFSGTLNPTHFTSLHFTEFVYDVVVEKFTFAISSPDEFHVNNCVTSSEFQLQYILKLI